MCRVYALSTGEEDRSPDVVDGIVTIMTFLKYRIGAIRCCNKWIRLM